MSNREQELEAENKRLKAKWYAEIKSNRERCDEIVKLATQITEADNKVLREGLEKITGDNGNGVVASPEADFGAIYRSVARKALALTLPHTTHLLAVEQARTAVIEASTMLCEEACEDNEGGLAKVLYMDLMNLNKTLDHLASTVGKGEG